MEDDYGDMEPQDVDGSLRPPPENLRRGDTVLTIYLEKWGFKDAAPFQVSVLHGAPSACMEGKCTQGAARVVQA